MDGVRDGLDQGGVVFGIDLRTLNEWQVVLALLFAILSLLVMWAYHRGPVSWRVRAIVQSGVVLMFFRFFLIRFYDARVTVWGDLLWMWVLATQMIGFFALWWPTTLRSSISIEPHETGTGEPAGGDTLHEHS